MGLYVCSDTKIIYFTIGCELNPDSCLPPSHACEKQEKLTKAIELPNPQWKRHSRMIYSLFIISMFFILYTPKSRASVSIVSLRMLLGVVFFLSTCTNHLLMVQRICIIKWIILFLVATRILKYLF